MTKILLFLATFTTITTFAEDPRMASKEIRRCVDLVKLHLRSTEYGDSDKETAIVSACKNADFECVEVVTTNLKSEERSQADLLLPLIKLCRGQGTGACLRGLVSKVASYDRGEAAQMQKFLNKCQ